MAFSHSFSSDFYYGWDGYKSRKPTTVEQALRSLPKRKWNAMCRDVFNCHPDYVDIDAVMQKIMETNTVRNLNSPVEVYIDEEGFHTVLVWDRK